MYIVIIFVALKKFCKGIFILFLIFGSWFLLSQFLKGILLLIWITESDRPRKKLFLCRLKSYKNTFEGIFISRRVFLLFFVYELVFYLKYLLKFKIFFNFYLLLKST